jgi:hypothetical protein
LQVSGFPGRDYGSGASEILAMAVKWPAISVSLILLCVELLSLTSGGLAVALEPSNWELCDKSAKYDVEVKNITIEPYPAVSGEDVTFIVPAIANQEITTAFVVVTVSFHGIPVHVERNDVCSQLKCPIGPGSFTLENTELLPTLTPPVCSGQCAACTRLLLKQACSVLSWLTLVLSFASKLV